VMRWLEICQLATGLAFWFLEFTDLFMCRGASSLAEFERSKLKRLYGLVPLGVVVLFSSGMKAASSRSLS